MKTTATRILPVVLMAALLALPAAAQQSYVTRFDVFTGYTFLDSPHVNLFENGFHFQVGVRPKPWYSLGFDYSITAGDLTLTPDLLPTALQATLTAELGQLAAVGQLPPGYTLVVPSHSRTQTFAAGPQLSYRHFEAVTLFARPSIGYIHELATPNPRDAIATLVVQQLAPGGSKTDWVPFYGFGGGIDFNVTKHVGIRVQADFVHDHLFNDILRDGRNTVRFSVGPCFDFGKNIVQ